MPPEEYKYWAFISYSHADERWAGWLHRALEGYRIPERLVGKDASLGPIPKKLFPVFRDRDELAGSSSLGPELQKALHRSRSMIVVCSPRAASSHWVNEEIKYFKSLGRDHRVFALIVDGEPHALAKGDPELECFPEALRFNVSSRGEVIGDEAVEPIAADARRHGDGKGHAKLKLIAGILGIGFDDLRQREMQARNRRLALLAGLASGVAALTLVLAVQAYYARNDAQRRQRQAEDLIQFMLGDLRKNLEPIGKLDILDAVGDKAMEYFGSLDEQDLTDSVLLSRATALRQVGEIRAKQGDLEEASAAFRQALKLDSELVARHPLDTRALFNVAESQYSVGYGHYARGELAEAQPWFERQLGSVQRLVELEPDNPKWQAALAGALGNLGGVAQVRRDPAQATAHFQRALKLRKALVEQAPDNREYLIDLSGVHGWLAHIETENGENERALEQVRQQNEILRRLVNLAPDHADYQYRLAAGQLNAAYIGSLLNRPDSEAPELQEALHLSEQLVHLDASNVTYARLLAVALSYLEDATVIQGRLSDAQAINQRALDLARDLFRRAPASAEALDDVLNVHVRAAKLAMLEQERAQARTISRQALELLAATEARQDANAQRGLELQLLLQWSADSESSRGAAALEARRWHERLQSSKQAPKRDLMLRFEALNGSPRSAENWADKLSPVERGHPYIQQFCRDFSLKCRSAAAS